MNMQPAPPPNNEGEKEKRRIRSLSLGMVDLAHAINAAPDTIYDVVIVGSGYGGSVAAQQLAGLQNTSGRKLKICVLERGKEYLPGMFPSTFAELPAHLRLATQGAGKVTGRHEGLFDIRPGDDVAALVANGLGGGSLINAGVLIEPNFSQCSRKLPNTVEADLKNKYFGEARKLLLGDPFYEMGAKNTIARSPTFPRQFPLKFQRLSELGSLQKKPLQIKAAEISVALADQGASAYNVNMTECNGCGDCMTGCNVGAKASLDTNLLAQASRDEVEIYTGASVLSLSRIKDKTADAYQWSLEVVHTAPSLRAREAGPLKLRAHKVILAAGTFGSTEILLRSRSDTLMFSSMLGERFSCNGDNIAAIHKLKNPADSTADEHVALGERHVGPTITGILEVAGNPTQNRKGFLIQEFAVPAPLKRLFAELVTTGHVISQLPTSDRDRHGEENKSDIDPCAVNDDAIQRTLLVGLIGHDDAAGVLRLPVESAMIGYGQAQEGTLQIVWPQARHVRDINAAHACLVEMGENAFPEASTLANPMWRLLPEALEQLVDQPRGPVMTVHPLGGCPMGLDDQQGVVGDDGHVFNTGRQAEDDWQGSLIVLDGSIIPGSLGANPALTISALALRAIESLIKSWKFTKTTPQPLAQPLTDRPRFAPAKPSVTKPPKQTQVEVVERLWGFADMHAGSAIPERCVLELTLSYQPIDLSRLMSSWGERELPLNSNSYLRVFKADLWDQELLRVQDDGKRAEHAIWKTGLAGSLRFLQREQSSAVQRRLHALWAYALNRGMRDTWQEIFKAVSGWFNPTRPEVANHSTEPKKKNCPIKNAWRLASRAGEVRRFDYDLTLLSPPTSGNPVPGAPFDLTGLDCRLVGHKRLTYNRRANPLNQLTTLTLTKMPFMSSGCEATLHLDTRFMAKQGIALVKLSDQENQPNALLDMASFGLFITRLMLSIHLWTFRKPDEPSRATPQRLPGNIAGLPLPEVIELTVALKVKGVDAKVRLTRYPRHDSILPPLAMIHGYSVSGTTFTHPSLKPSTAEFFWHQGRDVWVIDMRTSAGMPTATLPWSFEEAALVDIPSALVHIKNVTGKRVDVLAHCIGAAMTSMAILTEARSVKRGDTELGLETWMTSTQLGTLSTFNGDGALAEVHPTVNKIVLSQKGPLLRYTEANIFRAYLMRSLRRWLVPNGYQFRPPARAKVADQLLDRLLSALPYPDADYDMENPVWPCATTPWTASRHRMDALYARDFSAQNLRKETLLAIDDLFGPINLDTVSQTIHFVRFNCITNQRGRGEFVTLGKLATRWRGIPTFAIHGADNGLADVTTQNLLKANFEGAGVSFHHKIYLGFGHQDVLIGKTSGLVFQDIEKFLRSNPVSPLLPATSSDKWQMARPWIGPRIQVYRGALRIYALSSPRFGAGKLVLIPVKFAPLSAVGSTNLRLCGPVLASYAGGSNHWRSVVLPPIESCGDFAGWLALIAYPRKNTTLQDAASISSDNVSQKADANARRSPPIADPNDKTLAFRKSYAAIKNWFSVLFLRPASLDVPSATYAPSSKELLPSNEEIDRWLNKTKEDLTRCFVSKEVVARHTQASRGSFSFALSSCQYPPGIFDKSLAEKSLSHLASSRIGPEPLDFVIFAGDQIYADASAGLVDPTRSDERFDVPYETALQTEAVREIMRQAPVHMMLDDHEIIDNWEPPNPKRAKESRLANKQRLQGLRAYWKYQRLDTRIRASDRTASYGFDSNGAAFYMLDTRSRRGFRKTEMPEHFSMFPLDEMASLKQWLQDNRNKLKFIVSPAMLLPRRLGVLDAGRDQVVRGDAWDGYPSTMRALFNFILDEGLDHIVFLSGDEHLSCVATATLSKVGKPDRKIVSIHASGLYAPFPFANSKPEDFVNGAEVFRPGSIGKVMCAVQTSFVPAGKSIAKITVTSRNGVPVVGVRFCGDGPPTTYVDLLNF